MDCGLPGYSVRGISQDKDTGEGCHFFQEIFLTQGSNWCLLHWQVGSLPLAPPRVKLGGDVTSISRNNVL